MMRPGYLSNFDTWVEGDDCDEECLENFFAVFFFKTEVAGPVLGVDSAVMISIDPIGLTVL